MQNKIEEDDNSERNSVRVDTPWFKLFVDKIDWKEVLVVAMVLLTIVYLVRG